MAGFVTNSGNRSKAMPPAIESTVNLVADDPRNLESAGQMIRSAGFRVERRRSTDEFLNRHDEHRPECLLADLGMRAMDGIAILSQLNACEDPLPVVFLVSHASIADTVSLMQFGAVSLLEKPCRERTLIGAIQSAVRLDLERRMVADKRNELQQRMSLLSNDERMVLHDLVAGQTNKRIASNRGIALRTVEYRRHSIFEKLDVQSVAEMTATVAELERLADVSALLSEPPMRLANSRFRSFCIPSRLRSAGGSRAPLDGPHAGPRESHWRENPVQDSVRN